MHSCDVNDLICCFMCSESGVLENDLADCLPDDVYSCSL